MIRNQWYVVLESNEVKPKKPVGVTRLGEKLVFWRDSHGKVNCLHDRCPHLGAQLCQGKVNGDNLACPSTELNLTPAGSASTCLP